MESMSTALLLGLTYSITGGCRTHTFGQELSEEDTAYLSKAYPYLAQATVKVMELTGRAKISITLKVEQDPNKSCMVETYVYCGLAGTFSTENREKLIALMGETFRKAHPDSQWVSVESNIDYIDLS